MVSHLRSFVASSCLAGAVFAQDLAVTARALSVALTAAEGAGTPVRVTVAPGTSLGPDWWDSVSCSMVSASANLASIAAQTELCIVASVGTVVGTLARQPLADADFDALIELHAPRPMRVRVDIAQYASLPGSVTVSEVDFGNDGTIEVGTPTAGQQSMSQTLLLPAGTFPIRASLRALDRSALARCLGASIDLRINPEHVSITPRGTHCGAWCAVTPLLDGESVQVAVGGLRHSDLPFLILGSAPVDQLLPFAPGCSLLVQPGVVLPMASHANLPLGRLGPVVVHAQEVALRASSGEVLTSMAAAITVH
jgi:hypothetical protein